MTESAYINSIGGSFTDSEIIVLLGENGMGKTTLIRMLAGNLEPDGNGKIEAKIIFVSFLVIKSFFVTSASAHSKNFLQTTNDKSKISRNRSRAYNGQNKRGRGSSSVYKRCH
jgi:translation initiation factor RLI1